MSRIQAVSVIASLVLGALAACGDPEPVSRDQPVTVDSEQGSGIGSCALVVIYEGKRYSPVRVEIAPQEGEPAGSATLPPCNDAEGSEESAEEISVSELPGVSPEVALVWPGRHEMVLVREGTEEMPSEVARLREAPPCDPEDAPIHLSGMWLGILEPDESTEVDLVPPYDIEMLVADASPSKYVGANLVVRVPKDLGRPLSSEDVESSLWEGGTIEVTAECDRGFVATKVMAFPPD